MSWEKYTKKTKDLSKAMISNGVQPQQKVLIVSKSSPSSSIAYNSSQMIGSVPVVLSPNSRIEDLEHVANETKSPIMFVEGNEEFKRIIQHRNLFPNVKTFVCLDKEEKEKEKDLIPFKEFKEKGKEIEESEVESRILNLKPEDPATIVFTELGSSRQRGVILSHEALSQNSKKICETMKPNENTKYLSMKPLSELNEQLFSVHVPAISGSKVYFPETKQKNNRTKELIENMKEVEPDVVVLRNKDWKNVCSGIPPNLDEKEKQKEKEKIGLNKCSYAISIDGPLPKNTTKTLEEVKLPVLPVYEEIEAGGLITFSKKENLKHDKS